MEIFCKSGGENLKKKMETEKSSAAEVMLYTDGACKGNPGPGGWAFILKHRASGKSLEAWGSQPKTTNNQMELRSVIEGLKRLKRSTRVHVVTDSAYLKNGITLWLEGWKSRNWMRKTSQGLKPVKNLELWQELDRLIQRHRVTFEHVKGHAGHPENERCDQLAVQAYKKLLKGKPSNGSRRSA